MILNRRTLLAGLAGVALSAAHAAEYPNKPIRLVANSAPGGPTDFVARILSKELAADLRQPVVVENRTGAGGNIGGDVVAKSEPDGYTLLVAVDNLLTIAPVLYQRMPFNPDTDLKIVAHLGQTSMVLVTNPSSGIRTLPEFVAAAKRKTLTYSSAGNGSPGHLTFERLAHQLGIPSQHVPYKGNAPAVRAIVAGEVNAGFLGTAGALQAIKAGQLVPLAVSTRAQTPALPNVPVVGGGFEVSVGFFLLAPAKTPEDVVSLLRSRLADVLAKPEISERLRSALIEPSLEYGPELQARMTTERAKWRKVIEAANVRVE